MPRSTIAPGYIDSCLANDPDMSLKPTSRVLWLGVSPQQRTQNKIKKGRSITQRILTFHDREHQFDLAFEAAKGDWLIAWLERLRPQSSDAFTYAALKADFENSFEDFELFWWSKEVQILRESGLVAV